MDDKLVICSQCNQEIIEGKYWVIFKAKITTEEKEYEVGIKRIIQNLNDYIMKKWYHLSASEILLLRPDIVLEYLKEQYKDKEILEWHLEGFYICEECYDIYKEIIPLI